MANAVVTALAPSLGSGALRLLARTLRIRREEKATEPLWTSRTPAIYVVWHARLLLLPYLYGHRGARVLIVVPDGPRGPAETVKPGVVALARMTGAPVVPLAFAASAEWRARSWDGFRIPKPFARCVVRFGEPLRVTASRERGDYEATRKEIETALHEVTWQVDEEVRR